MSPAPHFPGRRPAYTVAMQTAVHAKLKGPALHTRHTRAFYGRFCYDTRRPAGRRWHALCTPAGGGAPRGPPAKPKGGGEEGPAPRGRPARAAQAKEGKARQGARRKGRARLGLLCRGGTRRHAIADGARGRRAMGRPASARQKGRGGGIQAARPPTPRAARARAQPQGRTECHQAGARITRRAARGPGLRGLHAAS